jgi:hypothetical protein
MNLSDKSTQHTHSIRTIYPDFGIQSAEYRDGGQYNDLLIVNREYVFRWEIP